MCYQQFLFSWMIPSPLGKWGERGWNTKKAQCWQGCALPRWHLLSWPSWAGICWPPCPKVFKLLSGLVSCWGFFFSREIPVRHHFYVAGKAFLACRGVGPLLKCHLAEQVTFQQKQRHHAFPCTQRQEVKTRQPWLLFSPGTTLLQKKYNTSEKWMGLTFLGLDVVPHVQILPKWAAVAGKEQREHPRETNQCNCFDCLLDGQRQGNGTGEGITGLCCDLPRHTLFSVPQEVWTAAPWTGGFGLHQLTWTPVGLENHPRIQSVELVRPAFIPWLPFVRMWHSYTTLHLFSASHVFVLTESSSEMRESWQSFSDEQNMRTWVCFASHANTR